MISAKEEVKQLMDKLPDDCTLEDIQYHMYVIGKIQCGLEQAANGVTISHDEVKARLGKWLTK